MESLAMGDYGVYVWSCIGLTFAVLLICTLQSRSRHRKMLLQISRQLQAKETGK